MWKVVVARILAIDIGGTMTAAAIIDRGTLLQREEWASPRHAGEALRELERRTETWSADACGIGFGGPYDAKRQRTIRSMHVPGWEDFDLVRWGEERLGVRTVADNDGLVGALGEWAGEKGVFVYLTLSTGIGGGLLIDGAPLRGENSLAAEFGHICLEPDGDVCECGNAGCAERLLGGLWLERDFGMPAQELFTDPKFSETYAHRLAMLLSAIARVLDPQTIVLGGGIGVGAKELVPGVTVALERLWSFSSAPHIRVARHGRDSVLIGAGELTREENDIHE